MKRLFVVMLMAGAAGSVATIPLKLLEAVANSTWYVQLCVTESCLLRMAVAGVCIVCGLVTSVLLAVGIMFVFVGIPPFRRALQWSPSEQPVPVMTNGRKRLRLDPLIRAGGWFTVLFALASACVFSVDDSGPAYSVWARRAACVPIGAFGTLSILAHRKCALEYDAHELRYVPLFGRAFVFAWEDVKSVRFLKHSENWELRLADGRKTKVSKEMTGARDFLRTLTGRTGVKVPEM